jgi:hypothetical protein
MPFTFCVTRRSQGAVSHPDGCLYEDALHIPTQISLSSRNAAPHPGSCVILLRMLLLMPTEFGLLFPGTLSFMCLLRSLVLLRTLVGSLPLSSRNAAPHQRSWLLILRMLLRMPTEFGLLFPGTLSFMCLLRSLVLLRTLVDSRPFRALGASTFQGRLVCPACKKPFSPCSLSNAKCHQCISIASMHYLLRTPFGPWEHLPCRVALLAPPAGYPCSLSNARCQPFWPWEHLPCLPRLQGILAHSLMQDVNNTSSL